MLSHQEQEEIEIYQAPKPVFPWTTWLKTILIRVFFPPVLLWDALKFIVNSIAGNWFSNKVLQAQEGFTKPAKPSDIKKYEELLAKNDFAALLELRRRRKASEDKPEKIYDKETLCEKINTINESGLCTAKKITVITHDKAKLDTLQITHPEQTKIPTNQQQYVINFVANAGCYEQNIEKMHEDAKELKCNVIGFNLRGVSQSTGKPKSANDLVIDSIAQVQRLLDKYN